MTEQEYLAAKSEVNELDKKLTSIIRKIALYERENVKKISKNLIGRCFLDTCNCYCVGIKYENGTLYYVAVDTIYKTISIEEDNNPTAIRGYFDSLISKEEFIEAYRSFTSKIQDEVSKAIGGLF